MSLELYLHQCQGTCAAIISQPPAPPPLSSCKMLSAEELIHVLCTFSIPVCLCVSFVSVFLQIVHERFVGKYIIPW